MGTSQISKELDFPYSRNFHCCRFLYWYVRSKMSLNCAVLTWYFRLDKRGITILGKVESGSFGWDWPIHWDNFTSPTVNIQQVLSSSFVIAILGYFESMVGVKYLAVKENDVHKPNRELVALGAGNVVACTNSLLVEY